jgi:iron complex outermembrane receptor protein
LRVHAQQALPEIEIVSPSPLPARRIVRQARPAIVPEVSRPARIVRAGAGVRARGGLARRRLAARPAITPQTSTPEAAAPASEPVASGGMERAKIPANVQVVTAVYQNGIRINEAFGDVVNWDLIPTNAIDRAVVFTNNPVFGLNALGGAISLEMKNGFTYQGTEIDFRGGSRGRAQASLQSGQQIGNFATYLALEGIDDRGFRKFSPSYVRRLYGDLGYRAEDVELHLNVGSASNFFGATAPVPIQLLQQDYSAVYTTPQTTRNVLGQIALNGTYNVTPTFTLQGNVYFRGFNQNHIDGFRGLQ